MTSFDQRAIKALFNYQTLTLPIPNSAEPGSPPRRLSPPKWWKADFTQQPNLLKAVYKRDKQNLADLGTLYRKGEYTGPFSISSVNLKKGQLDSLLGIAGSVG
jgi:hypothetical protein